MKKIESDVFCYLNSFKTISSANSCVEKLYTYLNISIRNGIVLFMIGKRTKKTAESEKIKPVRP